MSCETCGITPREVFPRKAGVTIGVLPGNVKRPRRGASAPVVFKRVKSSISGGSFERSGFDASCDMLLSKMGEWDARFPLFTCAMVEDRQSGM